jgi:hypothetical protein
VLVSNARKFIFIHIQKTAGSSITEALRRAAPDARMVGGRHIRARDAVRLVGRKAWGESLSFAFVRNPWDRLVSWYERICARTRPGPPFGKQPRAWRMEVLKYENFEDFVLNATGEFEADGVVKSFAFDQLSYLEDASGKPIVGFVGRYETLADDFASVCRRIALPSIELSHQKANRINRDYRPHYSDRTAEIVAERFKRDIAAFGYRF